MNRVLFHGKILLLLLPNEHSWFNSYAPELVPIFYSVIKHGYRIMFFYFLSIIDMAWKCFSLTRERMVLFFTSNFVHLSSIMNLNVSKKCIYTFRIKMMYYTCI